MTRDKSSFEKRSHRHRDPNGDVTSARPNASDSRQNPLESHLFRVDVFKIGLRNSLGIDFRTAKRTTHDPQSDRHSDPASAPKPELFHYLGEILPLVQPRVNRLPSAQRKVYETLQEHATESFWEIYVDFQPMAHAIAQSSGVEVDLIDRVLGRAILLFNASRGTKFVTYLEKTLRESIKNLRGRILADELGLPLSAGRLVPQIRWQLQQAEMQHGSTLSPEEHDRVVIEFLNTHRCKFSGATMQHVADVLRSGPTNVSWETCQQWLEPSMGPANRSGEKSVGNDCFVERQDECEFQFQQIRLAIEKADFDAPEKTLVLSRLDLPHDVKHHERIASRVTEASLRKRKNRLLVRLLAARYCDQAIRFGPLLLATPQASRVAIQNLLAELAEQHGREVSSMIDELLNWMSLSESVYRISIAERGKLLDYLSRSKRELPGVSTVTTPLHQKLKAVLIEQERLSFPSFFDV